MHRDSTLDYFYRLVFDIFACRALRLFLTYFRYFRRLCLFRFLLLKQTIPPQVLRATCILGKRITPMI